MEILCLFSQPKALYEYDTCYYKLVLWFLVNFFLSFNLRLLFLLVPALFPLKWFIISFNELDLFIEL